MTPEPGSGMPVRPPPRSQSSPPAWTSNAIGPTDSFRAAVERQFEIMGEALNQLSRRAPDLTARIPELRAIVAFRNLLIHGYASVDDAIVWRAVTEKIPALRTALDDLLAERGSPDT